MSSIEKAINKHGAGQRKDTSSATTPKNIPSKRAVAPVKKDKPLAPAARKVDIDFDSLSGMGFLSPDDNSSPIAQELRIVKRPILNNAFQNAAHKTTNNNLLVVTSALPGEGKTFSAINIALSIAMEVDRTVLLVDADNARAGISSVLGFEAGVGLSDLLSDPSLSINDVLIETNMPNLSLISAGTQKPNMTELLASDAMKSLVADLSNHYPDRIVIFDSSPITVTTESRVLASLVNQALLVVEANGTPQQVVKAAIENLGRGKEIGILLNKTLGHNVTGYGYGYGSRN